MAAFIMNIKKTESAEPEEGKQAGDTLDSADITDVPAEDSMPANEKNGPNETVPDGATDVPEEENEL